MARSSKSDRDNHANQCNRNNDAYWQSRGENRRPDDWDEPDDGQDEVPRPESNK